MTEVIKRLKGDLLFAQMTDANAAVMTTQEAVRGVLLEIEELDKLNRKYFAELVRRKGTP